MDVSGLRPAAWLLLTAGALWLPALGAAGGAGPAPRARSALRFARATHVFDDAFAGEELVHEFRFRNTGSSVVRVLSVKPTCGCVAALTDGDRYEPGQTGAIRVVFDTRDRFGRQQTTVYVLTDEPDGGAITLQMLGVVRVALMARPAAVIYGNVLPGKEYPARVYLRVYEPVRNLTLATDGGFLSAEPIGESEVPDELRLTLRSPDGPGVLEGAVTLSYEHSETGRALETRVPVRIAVLGSGGGP